MLLFLIGLEVRPQRLWVMRRAVFGLGTAQVVDHRRGAGGARPCGRHRLAGRDRARRRPGDVLHRDRAADAGRARPAHRRRPAATPSPCCCSRTSRSSRWSRWCRCSPATACPTTCPGTTWRARVGAIAVILVGGRFLLRPLFRAIGGAKTPEVFTTVALLIVAGTALLATVAGLSPSLGAFMAGVLLSESEYRHELQADIEPFEGLLLGFFFISVGMSADLPLARAQPALLAAATAALLLAEGGDRVRAGAHRRAGHGERAALRPRACRRPASSASCCSPPPSPPAR